jgi:proline iminopeptidase
MRSLAAVIAVLALGACKDPDEPGNLVPATVDEDPSLPSIEINGTLLHAEAYGAPDAPLVITLHGGPGSDYRSMLPLAALADDGYRVVFWDQRATGLSQRLDYDAFDNADYLEDLRLVIEHYTVTPDQPVVFIGHSWGAMYATELINTYGDYGGRIRGAILSEPGAFTKAQLDTYLDEQNAEITLTSEQLNDALWSRQFISPASQERADYLFAQLAFIGRPSEHHDPAKPTPFWRYGAVCAQRLLDLADDDGFDFTTHLDAYPHEVLFLRGGLNDIVTLEKQQALAASYPHAHIITLPNVGHELIWEDPDDYLANVRDYFQQIAFPGATP